MISKIIKTSTPLTAAQVAKLAADAAKVLKLATGGDVATVHEFADKDAKDKFFANAGVNILLYNIKGDANYSPTNPGHDYYDHEKARAHKDVVMIERDSVRFKMGKTTFLAKVYMFAETATEFTMQAEVMLDNAKPKEKELKSFSQEQLAAVSGVKIAAFDGE